MSRVIGTSKPAGDEDRRWTSDPGRTLNLELRTLDRVASGGTGWLPGESTWMRHWGAWHVMRPPAKPRASPWWPSATFSIADHETPIANRTRKGHPW